MALSDILGSLTSTGSGSYGGIFDDISGVIQNVGSIYDQITGKADNLPPAQPATAPVQTPAPAQTPAQSSMLQSPAVLVVGAVVLLGVLLVIRR